MATRTSDDLTVEVLRCLAIIDATEQPTTEDAAYVKARYYDKYDEMSAPPDELAYWDLDTIPSELFLTLRDLIANEVKGAFGFVQSAEEKESADVVIMRRLRRQVATKTGGGETWVDYY